MSIHPLIVASSSIFLSVLAQVALKFGTTQALKGQGLQGESVPMLRVLMASLMQPAVLFGFALYGAGALLWLYVLARWDVSKAYPLVSLGFVFTLAIGSAFMGERLSSERLLGCLLICGGLILIVRS